MRLEKKDVDFRECLSALLDRDFIPAHSEFDLHAKVRRNATRLNTWLAERTGWRVQEHAEFVRIVKTTRPELSHAPEWARDSRDYEMFAWILWFREQIGGRRCTLSQLADGIKEASAEDAAESESVDWGNLNDKRRLVRAMSAAVDIGAVRIRDGSLDNWRDNEGKRDALLEWGALSWHLEIAASVETLSTMSEAPWNEVPDIEGASAPARIRGYRQILLCPALFRREDPAGYYAIVGAEDEVRAAIHQALGWELEVTSSYARVLRSTATSIENRPAVPADSSEHQLVILLAGELRRQVTNGALTGVGDDFFRVRETDLQLIIAALRDQHREKWNRKLKSATSERLASVALPLMRRWGLLRGPDADGNLYVGPLASRLDGEYITALAG